jgi:tellurite methyltransferase
MCGVLERFPAKLARQGSHECLEEVFMSDARKHWDEKFGVTPFAHGKEPTEFFKRMLPRLQKGKTLDVGMGEGVNAVHLAKAGFAVKGFDVSQVAVAHARELAQEAGVSIECQVVDLDLYLFGLMEYDSIIMSFFKPPVQRYYSELIRALKQGGTLLVQSYMIGEMSEAIAKEESYRNYYYGINELLRNISELQILFYSESIEGGKHVVQCLARKPLDKDAVKYNLFDMHTKNIEKTPSKHLDLIENLFKK